ncbi:TIGR00159 family protein [candidate division KSB1 bacterium]|nr:TIGR00159 family protein [candidate division KSB1 bacterium]
MTLFRIGFIKVNIFDILDIFVISFILYKLYCFIRGSRAAQMFVGLVLILISSLLARLLNMSGMTWIFNSLQTVWLIAFVIIFQPELRRMLIFIGQSRLIRYFVKVSSGKTFEEVIRAAVELSRRRLGGLIVLTRDMGIKTITETGILIQAEVSSPLIVSIFNKRSPLHDGAIIIQNDIIEAAKCILPLSHETSLSPNLGTRHRAALGLAEESDAVILVISEETGKISIALDGRLLTDLDETSIRNVLINAFKFSAEKK